MYHLSNTTPVPALQPYIKNIWWITNKGGSIEPNLIIPDSFPEIVFTMKGSCSIIYANGDTDLICQNHYLGQISGTTEFKANEEFVGLFVKLYPWASNQFFRIDQGDSLDRVTRLEDILNNETLDFIQDEDLGFEKKVELLQKWLISMIDEEDQVVPPLFAYATKKILISKGRLNLIEVLSNIKGSRRYLESLFAEHLGLPPDYYNQLIRIKDITRRISMGEHHSFKQLLLDYPYTDASHFSNDFKKRTGMTPSQFRSYMERFPIVEKERYLAQFRHEELSW